ncbi:chaperone modulatory protein CbpM [Nitrosospira sp. Nl5]|uniref:chaperone modulator CbpM n=1 Tax=Nitrosospira sp. Nl5 TaxID=200120 RepID=UPI00088CB771|nr:chaperone modulator CbpM [Nitrosospira sp. Nl5]SCY28961.1 chaperone modulatory protein CbpM [Nitrosospira sp. Nl5]
MTDETKSLGKQGGMPDVMPLEPGGIIPEEQSILTLDEISSACAVQTEYIIELVAEGVITPEVGAQATPERAPEISTEMPEPHSWRFTGMHLRHVRIASHLQSDLGINLAGVGLALQLLDEVEALRTRLNVLAAYRT